MTAEADLARVVLDQVGCPHADRGCHVEDGCPCCAAILVDIEQVLVTHLAEAAALRAKLAEAEQALTLIGDKAVCDWDDGTVGDVDAVVKDPRRYRDWLRDVMGRASRCLEAEGKLVAVHAALKRIAEPRCGDEAELLAEHSRIARAALAESEES
jgi:hypothetical protein